MSFVKVRLTCDNTEYLSGKLNRQIDIELSSLFVESVLTVPNSTTRISPNYHPGFERYNTEAFSKFSTEVYAPKTFLHLTPPIVTNHNYIKKGLNVSR